MKKTGLMPGNYVTADVDYANPSLQVKKGEIFQLPRVAEIVADFQDMGASTQLKLIGPIQPQGESHTDEKRQENQLITQGIVEKLMGDIHEVAKEAQRPEHSMKEAGKKAYNFLIEMRQILG